MESVSGYGYSNYGVELVGSLDIGLSHERFTKPVSVRSSR